MANYNVQRGLTQNFEVYYNNAGSARWLGIGTVDLPEIVEKTVDISGVGLLGDVAMPAPSMFESMEATIHWRTIHEDLTILSAPITHSLTLRSAQTNYDGATGEVLTQAVKILIQGLPKNTTLGKFEQASETESETTLEVLYLKITVDGNDLTEIDKFNYVRKVNGADYLTATRSALAL